MNQWKRLDPSEILVHNVKCQDQIDDILEDEMRKHYKTKFIKQARDALLKQEMPLSIEELTKQINEFVDSQSIPQLQQQTEKLNTEWW